MSVTGQTTRFPSLWCCEIRGRRAATGGSSTRRRWSWRPSAIAEFSKPTPTGRPVATSARYAPTGMGRRSRLLAATRLELILNGLRQALGGRQSRDQTATSRCRRRQTCWPRQSVADRSGRPPRRQRVTDASGTRIGAVTGISRLESGAPASRGSEGTPGRCLRRVQAGLRAIGAVYESVDVELIRPRVGSMCKGVPGASVAIASTAAHAIPIRALRRHPHCARTRTRGTFAATPGGRSRAAPHRQCRGSARRRVRPAPGDAQVWRGRALPPARALRDARAGEGARADTKERLARGCDQSRVRPSRPVGSQGV